MRVELEPFASKEGHTFDGQGLSGNAAKGTITNIEFTITKTCDLSGIMLMNGSMMDTVDMQILDDAAGTYSGTANALLNQFATNWCVCTAVLIKNLAYSARLESGMRVNFAYNNTNENDDRMIYINLDLHEIIAT